MSREPVTPDDLRAAAALVKDAVWPHRGFHFSGMADAEGFLAGGCDEVLIHGWDLAQGLGADLPPPCDLARRVLERLFPWVSPGDGEDPWELLVWSNGRVDLPGRERVLPGWEWHCAPLDEWDGAAR